MASSPKRQFHCCVYCKQKFPSLKERSKHVWKMHREKVTNPAVACNRCQRSFRNNHDKADHVRKFHNACEYDCPFCGREFRDITYQARHILASIKELHYPCERCPRAFSDFGRLQEHIKRHKELENETYKCDICLKVLCNKKVFSAHVRLHTVKKTIYKCQICSKSFSKKFMLTKHSEYHNTVCQFCGKRFDSKRVLQLHQVSLNRADESRNFQVTCRPTLDCQHCNYSFNSSTMYFGHLKTAHTEKVFHVCARCGLKFTSIRKKAKHVRENHGGCEYICVFCKKGFRQYFWYSAHIRRHIKEFPYGCPQCGKTWPTKDDVRRHIKQKHSNSQEIMCECPLCNKLVKNKQLESHLRKHTGEKPFKCDICGERFFYRNRLNQHQQACHLVCNQEVDCEYCHKKFKSEARMEKHLAFYHPGGEARQKTEQCVFCYKLFYKKIYLDIHILTHIKEKWHQCDFCSKHFSTVSARNVHLRQHTLERPYRCGKCTCAYATDSGLKNHFRLVHENPGTRRVINCQKCGNAYLNSKHNIGLVKHRRKCQGTSR